MTMPPCRGLWSPCGADETAPAAAGASTVTPGGVCCARPQPATASPARSAATARLLTAQRIDRIEPCGAPRRVEAEEDADRRRNPERERYRLQRHTGRPVEQERHPGTRHDADGNAN